MKIYGTGFVKSGKKGNYLKCKGSFVSRLSENGLEKFLDLDKNYYIRFEDVDDRKVVYNCANNEKFVFSADYVMNDDTTLVLTNLQRRI